MIKIHLKVWVLTKIFVTGIILGSLIPLSCVKEINQNFEGSLPKYQLLRNYTPRADRYMREHLINLLIEVALGAEYGNNTQVLKKWAGPMRLFVGGNPSQILQEEMYGIITEINALTTDGFYIIQTADSLQANAYLFLGSAQEFAKRVPMAPSILASHNGLVQLTSNGTFEIQKAALFVDTDQSFIDEQKHVLREELTQSLGLLNDVKYYPSSIFYEAQSYGDSFSTNDREIIRLLYNPGLIAGMDSLQIRRAGRRIMGLPPN